MTVNLDHLIKEETKRRCKIFDVAPTDEYRYCAVNPELFHFLYDMEKLDFTVYFRVEDTMVEFIKPEEFSPELLDELWVAMQKSKRPVAIIIRKNERLVFDTVIERVRKKKLAQLTAADSELDPKVLNVFSSLSDVSQLIVRGGITQNVVEQVRASATYVVNNLKTSTKAIATLSRMITHDPTLYDHSASVAMFSAIIATKCLPEPMKPREAETLTRCALYHDVGKTCVPSAILNKPGRFTPDEWEVMKTHAARGADELQRVIEAGAPIEPLAVRVAQEHHERMLGQGYPDGRTGRLEEDPVNGIHLYSRIVMIADVYSALLMKRVYKPCYEPQEAIKIMAEIGPREYDPEIFPRFLQHVVGSINEYEKASWDNVPNGERKDRGRILYIDDDGKLREVKKS